MGHGPHRPYVSRRQFVQRTAAVGIAAGAGPFLWQQPGYSAATPVEQVHGQFVLPPEGSILSVEIDPSQVFIFPDRDIR